MSFTKDGAGLREFKAHASTRTAEDFGVVETSEAADPIDPAEAPEVSGDWTALPLKVAHAYLRTAAIRPRPLWFHAVGIAALTCAATRPIWCTPEKEPR